jgi:hypothetical protein
MLGPIETRFIAPQRDFRNASIGQSILACLAPTIVQRSMMVRRISPSIVGNFATGHCRGSELHL